jgi:metallophosphoesterase superfamily enzyme
VQKQYKFATEAELIIAPAFNNLCGGLPLNEPCEELRGPLLTLADLDRTRIFLLDGTNLGLLSEIKSMEKSAEKKRTGRRG